MLAAIKHSQISQIFTPFDWLPFYQNYRLVSKIRKPMVRTPNP